MNKKMKGIMFIICAAFCFSLMNTFVKLSGDLPAIQKSFFRNFGAFVVATIVIIRSKEKIEIGEGNLKFLILRSLCGTFGILGNFYALAELNLADASMLGKLGPFFAIIASFFILNEKVNKFQILSIVIAFIGSLFIIKPTFATIAVSLPAFAAVLGAVGAGGAYTFVRLLGNRGVKGSTIIVFFSAFSCLVALPSLIFDYHPMTATQTFYLIMASLAATGGQFAVTNAYFCAPAKEISVYDYTQVLFAAITGFIIYRDFPDALSLVGYALIIGIGIITFFRNKKAITE